MSSTSTASAIADNDQRLVLNAIPWQQYEAVLLAFPEQAGLRITYLDGRLTLLSPKRRHEWYENTLGRLVEAVALGFGIEWEDAGHTTYRREDVGGDLHTGTVERLQIHATKRWQQHREVELERALRPVWVS